MRILLKNSVFNNDFITDVNINSVSTRIRDSLLHSIPSLIYSSDNIIFIKLAINELKNLNYLDIMLFSNHLKMLFFHNFTTKITENHVITVKYG